MQNFSPNLVIKFECSEIPAASELPFHLVFKDLPSKYYKATNIHRENGLIVTMNLDINDENPGGYISTHLSLHLGTHPNRPDSFVPVGDNCIRRSYFVGKYLEMTVTYNNATPRPVRKNYDQATHKGGRPGTLKKNK